MKTAKAHYSHPKVLRLVERINQLPDVAKARVHEAFTILEQVEKRALGLLAVEESKLELIEIEAKQRAGVQQIGADD